MMTSLKRYTSFLLPLCGRRWRKAPDEGREGARRAGEGIAILLLFFIPLSTTLTQIMMGLLIVTWILTGNIKEKMTLAFENPVVLPACFLFLIMLLGAVYSIASWPEVFSQLGKMSKPLYLIFLIPFFKDPKIRRLAFLAFIIAMTITLGLSFLTVYGGLSIPTRYGGASIFKNRIDTNLMMSLAIFLMGHQWMSITQKTKKLSILTVSSLMVFYCLWMSDGRTGHIILALLWILFCLQQLSFKKMLFGLSLLAFIIALPVLASLKSPAFKPQWQKRVEAEKQLYDQGVGQESSLGQRLEYFTQSIQLIRQRPWLGWGTGSFKTAYEEQALKQGIQTVTNPHNEYLNIMVQWGLLGLIGFLIWLGTLFKMSFKLPTTERYLAQGLTASLLIGSLANSLLMDVTSGYLFVVMTALCFGSYNKRNPSLISVIITTYNWPAALQAVLQALRDQKTRQPFEILIADDGSGEDTANLIKQFTTQFSVPLKHIWQPDQGFRAARIRNQAILASHGDYIVFLDGDCIPRPSFIEQQTNLADPGFFVVGHRVLLNQTFTTEALTQNLPLHQWSSSQWFWQWIRGRINRFSAFMPIPMGFLRKINPSRWRGAKGCNLAVWKADLQRVNGWEEQFSGWGYEDSDLVIRLLHAGLRRKDGRYAVPVIHLWHPENDRQHEQQNWQLLMARQSCPGMISEKGLNQYGR